MGFEEGMRIDHPCSFPPQSIVTSGSWFSGLTTIEHSDQRVRRDSQCDISTMIFVIIAGDHEHGGLEAFTPNIPMTSNDGCEHEDQRSSIDPWSSTR